MEMSIPYCAVGEENMFPLVNWNLTLFVNNCNKTYGVVPRTNWSRVQFWGKELKTVTNVIFR